jgi:tetratricopeptide (TPR) repeat protein
MQRNKMSAWKWMAGLCLLAVAIATPRLADAISKEEIITLTKLGISDDEVIKAIDKDRTVFELEIQDILALKQAGVTEGVIKHMLATPQLYGKQDTGGTPGATTAAPTTTADPTREKTPEELQAEQDAIRQEAMRLAEEAKKVRDAQRKLYAQSILQKGQELAEDGQFVEAINQFQTFVSQGNFPPGSEEAYVAKYGIANALLKANLLQSAAKTLVEVVLEGPDRPFFQPALRDLRQVRKKISYSPPDLEEMTKFYVGGFSQTFQDEFNYMLGEFFYDFNNYTQALNYFDQVSASSPDYGKALYLKGLVQVRNKLYRSALESFQNAILATEANDSDESVSDLAFLALARIAYESGDYDAAIYYYRKIPLDSPKLPIAFYESAWTYFVKGDFSRALGTFQALHSPYFSHYFFPELWILEGTIYLNMCRYDTTREALDMFDKTVVSHMEPLEQFLRNVRTPGDFYTAIVDTANGRKGDLPAPLVKSVLANADFYNLYRTIRQIDWESETVQKNRAGLGGLGEELAAKLDQLRQSKINEAGIQIQKVLKTTQGEMQNFLIKKTEIEVDLDTEMLRQADVEIARLVGTPEEQAGVEKASGAGAAAVVGADSLQWPFEGEYWKDEIGAYRAFVEERCTR